MKRVEERVRLHKKIGRLEVMGETVVEKEWVSHPFDQSINPNQTVKSYSSISLAQHIKMKSNICVSPRSTLNCCIKILHPNTLQHVECYNPITDTPTKREQKNPKNKENTVHSVAHQAMLMAFFFLPFFPSPSSSCATRAWNCSQVFVHYH